MAIEWWLLGFAFAVSLAGTFALRRYAVRRQILDVPNERSSHLNPTPRGGGLAIVASVLSGMAILRYLGHVADSTFYAVLGGGFLVAGIGFLDDRKHIPAGIRLMVHFAAAVWALYWLGDVPPLNFGWAIWHWSWMGNVFATISLVWLLNL
ncbi:MAG TPA: glycosyl transferase, partial [Burkholderiales bacterium]|nr:glycosyl transferase [Burkholderiales bacterium]